MEIIRRGQKPNEQTAEFDCKTCNSTLRAKREEGEDLYFDQRDGNSCIFRCPVCDSQIWVSLSLFDKKRTK